MNVKWIECMRRQGVLGLLLLLSLLLVSLVPTAAQQLPAGNLGELRLVNALTGLGNIDLYLNGVLVRVDLPPEAASSYLNVPAGRHRLEARMVGSDATAEPVASDVIDVAANSVMTAVIYQSQFSGIRPPTYAAAGSIFSQVEDRNPIPLGGTRLTAIHLATGAPNLLSVAYPSRASIMHQVSYAQTYGTVDVAPGIYRLTLVDAALPDLPIRYRAGEVNLFAGALYTFIIVPDLQVSDRAPRQTDQVRFFVLTAPLDPPSKGIALRIIHTAVNTDVVDVYVDERLVASRLSFGQFTTYIGLERYSHVIALRPYNTPADSPALARLTLSLNAENESQQNWSLLLLNASQNDPTLGQPILLASDNPALVTDNPNRSIPTRGGPMILALTPDDVSQTQSGFARVRLVHALVNFPALTLNSPTQPLTPGAPPPTNPVLGPRELVPDTEFGFIAGEEEVPAGIYEQVNVQVAFSGQPITALGRQQLSEGQVYTYVVASAPNPNEPPRIILIVDHGEGISSRFSFAGQLARNQVNVREQATVNSALLATLNNNAGVIVLGRNADAEWVRIRFSNPSTGRIQEGWMSAGLLIVTRQGARVNINTLPVVSNR
jgi:hypothetical protein